ncbi:hypothetical protein ACFT30_14240, partial [Microbacterium ureisolvens]|uniref:hypothetical protein n=1 Tax=Microbacterium ureisolvens TaxID=2781186 RepID=UPI00362E14CC
MPIAEVPTDPALWASKPYSPLAPSEIPVEGNNAVLDFGGAGGGLNASGDVPTGFTMVQPSTADSNYYVPQNLAVNAGKLNITATKGIAYLVNGPTGTDVTKNQQDNTLGVGLEPAGKRLRLTTTLDVPTNMSDSAQGGLWFGPNDDNYVKLNVIATGATTRQIQIAREIGGVANSASTADQVNTPNVTIPASTPVTLFLEIVNNTAIGSYQIGTGPVVTVATLNLPANFSDGTAVVGDYGVQSFGGIYATKRNMLATTNVMFAFDRFAVTEVDTVAPAAPGSLAVSANVDQNAVTWSAPADTDVVGYRVYRSATASPVPADAANLVSGVTPIDATSFADRDVFVGQTWNYSVYAVDGSGNVSPAASVTAVTPAPAGTVVRKYDFTTPAADAAPGYVKDAGAPYSDAAGFGWVTADDRSPHNFALNTRVRTAASGVTDPRLLSLIHLQYGMTTNANPATGVTNEEGVWEVALPDGRYNVVVAAGDTSAGNFDSTHTVLAEGTSVVNAFAPTAATVAYDQGVAEVTVTDGKLTLEATGGDNTKLSFVEIYQLELFGPAAPTGLEASLSEDEETVSLNWEPVADATGYNIFRSDVSPVDTSGTALNSSPVKDPSFADDEVVAGASYYYVVVAVADGPPSVPSNEVKVDVPAAPSSVEPPANVAANAGEDRILVTWESVQGASGYKVYRGSSASVEASGVPVSGSSAISGLSFEDLTAVPGLTYYYVVVAIGAGGATSPPSEVAFTKIQESVEPGACVASEWSGVYYGDRALTGL